MRISDDGLALLRHLEGARGTAYPDAAGLWTIGIGHLLARSELSSGKILLSGGKVLRYKDARLTTQEMEALLRSDMRPVDRAIAALVAGIDEPLAQYQHDALCSFVFNIGATAFKASTLLKQLTLGHFDAVPAQMRRWVYAAGRVINGLKNRREAEVAIWEGRSYDGRSFFLRR